MMEVDTTDTIQIDTTVQTEQEIDWATYPLFTPDQITRQLIEYIDTMKSSVSLSRLSPSSISTWLNCPRKWFYERIAEKREGSIATLYGHFVHTALEELFKLNNGERTVTACKTICTELGNTLFASEEMDLMLTEAHISKLSFKQYVWTMLMNYFTMEDPNNVHIIATEQVLEGTVGGVPILGIIDRIDKTDTDGQCIIVDYKTSKAVSKYSKPEYNRQIAIYSELVTNELNYDVKQGTLLYVKPKSVVNVSLTPKLIKSTTDTVVSVYDHINTSISTGTFLCQRNPLCNWCPHMGYCPAYNALIPF